MVTSLARHNDSEEEQEGIEEAGAPALRTEPARKDN